MVRTRAHVRLHRADVPKHLRTEFAGHQPFGIIDNGWQALLAIETGAAGPFAEPALACQRRLPRDGTARQQL